MAINLPLRKVLQKFDILGRLLKWSLEFNKFDITYHPWSAIKTQVTTNFLVEYTNDSRGERNLWELSEEVTTREPKEY